MSKGSHRHNHHYQHHLYPHHSSYGHLAADGKDKVPGLTVANKVSSGTPILYEDASGHFKKTDVEATKMASPRPALRINISKGEEKRSYEKPPHSPLSPPSSLPDHIKCSLLKAQMDAAFGVGPQVCKEDSCVSGLSKSPSLQSSNVRSPASLRTESTQSTGSSSSKQENRPPRLKKLTRQYSFNHSDEDDLPPALAAVAAESAAEHRAALLLASNGNSQASSVEKSPSKVNSPFALEPGDLLMDFTEATPMIKAYPADPSNSFFDPFTTVQPYPVDLLETPFQQYSPPAKLSPKRMSPAIHMVPSRQLKNQVQAMQTAHLSHISIVDSSEALKRELEREKMMKRLLMTEL
ncbi:band 4.1-like protein 4B [Hyperolius riggenbachi]|uniref:band 4.1-like protein 4B n=1 Tax=Hyperolius riggenbachi TaxID=752182 RepID=UPI0035A27111